MVEDQRADEMQVRALEARAVDGSNGRAGFSAQILPFALASRTATIAAPDLMFQTPPIQPQPMGEAPLSENLAYVAEGWLGVARSWLSDAMVELEQLSGVAKENGYQIPPPKSIERARGITTICSHMGLSEPAFDVRENGEIEIFCREGSRGILMLIYPNDLFQVFGDFDSDKWRARYESNGPTWRRHLRSFLQEVMK